MKMKSEECMKGTHMSLIILSIVKSTNGIPFILQKRRCRNEHQVRAQSPCQGTA